MPARDGSQQWQQQQRSHYYTLLLADVTEGHEFWTCQPGCTNCIDTIALQLQFQHLLKRDLPLGDYFASREMDAVAHRSPPGPHGELTSPVRPVPVSAEEVFLAMKRQQEGRPTLAEAQTVLANVYAALTHF